jgi:hypothetical protein
VKTSQSDWLRVLLASALAGLPCACSHLDSESSKAQPDRRLAVPRAIQSVKQKNTPDSSLGIYNVGVQYRGRELILTGEVDHAEARIETIRAVERTGARVTDHIKVCDLVRKTGEEGDWYKVELPDQRAGFLPKKAAQDFAAWKRTRQPTAENIERTARHVKRGKSLANACSRIILGLKRMTRSK